MYPALCLLFLFCFLFFSSFVCFLALKSINRCVYASLQFKEKVYESLNLGSRWSFQLCVSIPSTVTLTKKKRVFTTLTDENERPCRADARRTVRGTI
jgi:predicted membrane metal-binding protein